MKKTIIFLFGLIMLTTSICPFGISLSFTPPCIAYATAIESFKACREVPVYVPGSIQLMDEEQLKAELWPNREPTIPYDELTLNFRYCYYMSYSSFRSLAYPDDFSPEIPQEYREFLDSLPRIEDFYPNGDAQEMPLVTLIKHFQVPKHAFVAEVERQREGWLSMGIDISEEMWELPNADIIYTFNNELINYYYRRA